MSTVNVMTMDYFDSSLDYAGHMGDLAIRAVRSTHRQLALSHPAGSLVSAVAATSNMCKLTSSDG